MEVSQHCVKILDEVKKGWIKQVIAYNKTCGLKDTVKNAIDKHHDVDSMHHKFLHGARLRKSTIHWKLECGNQLHFGAVTCMSRIGVKLRHNETLTSLKKEDAATFQKWVVSVVVMKSSGICNRVLARSNRIMCIGPSYVWDGTTTTVHFGRVLKAVRVELLWEIGASAMNILEIFHIHPMAMYLCFLCGMKSK